MLPSLSMHQRLLLGSISSSSYRRSCGRWILSKATCFLLSSSSIRAATAVVDKSSGACSTNTDAPPSITLYQYQICPFCNKTKVFFRYAGLSYRSVEVNPLTKKELKPWSGSYRKVPIAMIDEEQINGSDDIISTLLNKERVKENLDKRWKYSDMTIRSFNTGPHVQYWTTEYANDLATILYPNIASTWTDSYQMFNYLDNTHSFSFWEQILIRNIGSLAMTMAASKIKKKRGISNEREALQEALLKWQREGLQNGLVPYSSGIVNQPNLADLTVFAVLHSCQGMPIHDELIRNKGRSSSPTTLQEQDLDPLKQWYQRIETLLYS